MGLGWGVNPGEQMQEEVWDGLGEDQSCHRSQQHLWGLGVLNPTAQWGTGIGTGGMVGNRIWEVRTAGPKVNWGFWAEGENHRDVNGGPGLKVGVPWFGIKVLNKVWGTRDGDGGSWDGGFVSQLQNLLFFITQALTYPKILIPTTTLIPHFTGMVVALHPTHPLTLRC